MENTTKPAVSVVVETKQCQRHGEYSSRRYAGFKFGSSCPACVEERASEEARRKQVDLAASAAARMAACGIPKRYTGKSFDDFSIATDAQGFAHDAAQMFAEAVLNGSSACAIFGGAPGTGKTHLACAVVRDVVLGGKSALVVTVMDAIGMIRDTWGGRGIESDARRALIEPDLLVLDEVGVQFGSDAERVQIFGILNARYNACLPTLMVSNLSAEECKAYLGERVFDRLREDGGEFIPFAWESYRGRA